MCVAVVLFSINARAADNGETMIRKFNPWETGLFIQVKNNNHNISSCGNTVWLFLPNSFKNYKEIYSGLLASFMTKKIVKIYSYECDSGYSAIRGFIASH